MPCGRHWIACSTSPTWMPLRTTRAVLVSAGGLPRQRAGGHPGASHFGQGPENFEGYGALASKR